MKSLEFKNLPLGKLTVLFLAVAVISIVALIWMGVRLVSQDRTLEMQRLEELREEVADQFVAILDENLQMDKSRLANDLAADFHPVTEDTLLLAATAEELHVFPEASLLFHPAAIFTQATDSHRLFAVAEKSEFVDQNYERAIRLLRNLSRRQEPNVKVEANLRLARNLRNAGQSEAALEIYDELTRLEYSEVLISGVPVDLVAGGARCRILEELGRKDQLKEEAKKIHDGLEMGRWHLDRSSYYHYGEQVRKWTNSGLRTKSRRRALSEVVARVWNEWHARRRDKTEKVSHKCVSVDGTSVLALSRSSPESLTALILARISHKLATATANASVLTAFRSVGLLNILHEYACGGFGRRPCQIGAFTVSLRKPMRKAG